MKRELVDLLKQLVLVQNGCGGEDSQADLALRPLDGRSWRRGSTALC